MMLVDVIACGTEAAMVFEIHVTIGDSVMVMEASRRSKSTTTARSPA